MITSTHTGFAVVYQWRIKPGMEVEFRKAWDELTVLLKQDRGARGSRLHRTDYGTLVAYAQWPDQASWERSCALHQLDESLSKRMLDAVEETWSPMLLTPLSDHLLPDQKAHDAPNAITH